jgi:hypothetical protein
MNQWRKQYEEHALHKELAAINSSIETASLKTTDAATLDAFNRLVVVIHCFNAFVRALSPECTIKSYLDTLAAPLAQIRPQLDAFLKDENVAHLQNANNQADQLVQKMPPFNLPDSAAQQAESIGTLVKASEGLVQSVSEQSKKAQEVIAKVQSQSDSSLQRLAQLEQTIEAQKGRLDKAIADFQKQFSDSEATRRQEIQTTEGNFNKQFHQFKDKIEAEIRSLIDAQKAALSAVTQELKTSADKVLHQMNEKKDAAAKVLNVSTNVAVSGSYGKYAHQEKVAAEIFRGVALVFMGALIFGAYKTIEVALTLQTIDWKLLAIRAITTFTLALPAFYAVRESNKHRITESRYRRMQLELAAIDPYLELLEKSQRDEIKTKLSERFFAQPELKDETRNVDAGSLLDILKQVLLTLVKK